jgi:hypothetical protein
LSEVMPPVVTHKKPFGAAPKNSQNGRRCGVEKRGKHGSAY